MQHVLIRLVNFVVVDGSTYFSTNMMYQNRMTFTEIIILVSIFVPFDLHSVHKTFLKVLMASCHLK